MLSLLVCYLILCLSAGSLQEGTPRQNVEAEAYDYALDDEAISAPRVSLDEGEAEKEVLEANENLTSIERLSSSVFGKCDCRYTMSTQSQAILYACMAVLAVIPMINILLLILCVVYSDKVKWKSSEVNPETCQEKPIVEDGGDE